MEGRCENSHLSTKLTTENSKNTLKLKGKITTEELQMLHNKLWIMDKATGNFGFPRSVCSRLDQLATSESYEQQIPTYMKTINPLNKTVLYNA